MKKILMMGIASAAVMAVAGANAMTLAEAGGKVSEAANDPAVMASVMKDLSAGDQTKFIAAVNEAIESMPVSADAKAARYLAANSAALKNAKDLKSALAETYATVSLEGLTVLNEDFATNLFSRTADAANPVSDASMQKIATDALAAVKERTSQADVSNGDQRNTFAALTFIRASGGTPETLRDAVLADLPEVAGTEWVPAALGEGEEKTYDPLLGIGAPTPDPVEVNKILSGTIMPMAPDVLSGALLADFGTSADSEGKSTTPFTDVLLDPAQYALPDSMENTGLTRRPKTLNPEKPWYNPDRRGEEYDAEPEGYYGQTFRY